jgi:hypothetical protein
MSVAISNFGSSYDGHPDVVLICPHGDEGPDFVMEHNLRALVADPVMFDRYNILETDRGSAELSYEIARQVAAASTNLMIEVVEVKIPRSVVDCNRVPGIALRNVLDWKLESKLASEFTDIHGGVTDQVLGRLANMRKMGVYIDVHTMADYSPVGASSNVQDPALYEHPENLDSYVSSFLSTEDPTRRRAVDLICSKGSTLLADPRLLFAIEQNLQSSGMPSVRNEPYALSDRLMSTVYATRYSGITVDALKGSLLSGARNILTSPVDFAAVTRVATPFSSALIERLQS